MNRGIFAGGKFQVKKKDGQIQISLRINFAFAAIFLASSMHSAFVLVQPITFTWFGGSSSKTRFKPSELKFDASESPRPYNSFPLGLATYSVPVCQIYSSVRSLILKVESVPFGAGRYAPGFTRLALGLNLLLSIKNRVRISNDGSTIETPNDAFQPILDRYSRESKVEALRGSILSQKSRCSQRDQRNLGRHPLQCLLRNSSSVPYTIQAIHLHLGRTLCRVG